MRMASGVRRAARGWREIPLAARCSLLACFFANEAFAHAGHDHLTARQVMHWWSWEPVTLALLASSATLYAVGMSRIWQSTRKWQPIAFAAGWLALFIALISPLDSLGEILFSAHMAQHEMLMIVAAPLLVLGRL